MPPPDILERPECVIKPHMHQKLADWMLDVSFFACGISNPKISEASGCDRDVFPTAIVYVYRFVNQKKHVPINKLQLLGAVSLHVAIKFVGSVPIGSEKLCEYMENGYSLAEFRVSTFV